MSMKLIADLIDAALAGCNGDTLALQAASRIAELEQALKEITEKIPNRDPNGRYETVVAATPIRRGETVSRKEGVFSSSAAVVLSEKCERLLKQLRHLYTMVANLQGSRISDCFEAIKSLEQSVSLLPVDAGGSRLPTELTKVHVVISPLATDIPSLNYCPSNQETKGGPHIFDDNGDCIYCGYHPSPEEMLERAKNLPTEDKPAV